MTAEKNPNTKKIKDEDFELIQSINSGQTDKFHELVNRYEQKLYNFSLRMCRDHSDAEDMIQETFLNVFRYFLTDLVLDTSSAQAIFQAVAALLNKFCLASRSFSVSI